MTLNLQVVQVTMRKKSSPVGAAKDEILLISRRWLFPRSSGLSDWPVVLS